MASKWRIAFLHINFAQRALHLVELALILEKRYCLFGFMASYKPYTQSDTTFLSILVTMGLLWLQLNDTYRKFKPKYAKERADNSKYETFFMSKSVLFW